MKAYNILEQAAGLIATPIDETLKKAGVGLINTVLQDINLPTICSLTEEITAESGVLTIISSGVAMLLSIYLGDDVGTSQMSEIYNSLRRRLLCEKSEVKNTLFRGDEV